MLKYIKKIIPNEIKFKVKKVLYKINVFYFEKQKLNNWIKNYKDKKKIILFQTPEYDNLGDQAIAIAGRKILKEKYRGKLILEFTLNEYDRNYKLIRKLINRNDIIYFIGGGNLGNLYLSMELQRREIISLFPNNKIIIMPQSVSFNKDKEGEKQKIKTKEIYSKHRNLHIITRDEKSYEYGKEIFSENNIYLMPDTVLYLEDNYLEYNSKNRENVIFTIRKDKEKLLSNNKINEIMDILKKNNINYVVDDTTVEYGVGKETRDYEVENILSKIGKARLNITDRFHGVIFSIITNTPVIVFKSLDHKIEYGVRWFKHLEWVHYVSEEDDIENIILKYVSNDYYIEKDKYLLKEKLKDKFFKI